MTDASDIEVKQETTGGATILRPVGEIDLSRAPSLRTHLTRALGQLPTKYIQIGVVRRRDSAGMAHQCKF